MFFSFIMLLPAVFASGPVHTDADLASTALLNIYITIIVAISDLFNSMSQTNHNPLGFFLQQPKKPADPTAPSCLLRVLVPLFF